VILAAVNQIQALDAHLASSERFGVICVLFGEACMRLDRVKAKTQTNKQQNIQNMFSKFGKQEATEICVRAARWPSLTDRVVALFEKAGNAALENNELDAAVVRFTLCMDLSFPPSESVLYSRACTFQRKGMWREARADFAKLLELRPSSKHYKSGEKETRKPKKNGTIVPEFYKVLHVSVDATTKGANWFGFHIVLTVVKTEIKRAFRKLALSTHPDKVLCFC
jgi:hypothetical protein